MKTAASGFGGAVRHRSTTRKHEHTGADGRPIEVQIRVVPSVFGERK